MLLYFITIALLIISITVGILLFEYYGWRAALSVFGWVTGIILFFVFIIMTFCLFFRPFDKIIFEEKYSQTSTAAKIINPSDYGFAEVLNSTINLNKEIQTVRRYRDSVFIGKFYNYEIGNYPTINIKK